MDLTENEQYVLLNKYVSKDISNGKESLVSLYQTEELEGWLLKPESYIIQPNENVDLDSEIKREISIIPPKPWPGISDNKWKTAILDNFKILDEDTIEDIFKINRFYNTDITTIHYLSPILYNPKNNLALIVDKPISIKVWECEPRAYYYLYLKDGNEWESLKKYGTDNIALIMERYKENNTSL